MKPYTEVRNRTRNWMVGRKVESISPSNIYARVYASFHQAVSRPDASIEEAARAIEGAVQGIIDQEQHYYDLVVLAKTPERVRVRDRRGGELEAIDLVTNSYNDLEWVPENREALARFVRDEPLSSCISRKIAGLHKVHDQLRTEMADFLGYDACVLGTCGYITQISTLFALFHEGDVIFSDQHNHSSLVDGCRLSHARVIPYPHQDYDRLAQLLQEHRRSYNGAGILSDGVFSTKGSVADVDRIVDLARRHNCLSVIDDTHGVGVLGPQGRGVVDLFSSRPDVITGGFGKAMGSFGGFTVANRALATVIDVNGRQNVNTSFLSPLVAAQSLIHLRYYRSHHDQVSGQLNERLRTFNAALDRVGLACYPAPDEHLHPIFCLFRKDELATLQSHKRLIAEGFLPSFFPPPVAPWPSLRMSLHRCLPLDDLERLAGLLGEMKGLFVDSGGRVRDVREREERAEGVRARARQTLRKVTRMAR